MIRHQFLGQVTACLVVVLAPPLVFGQGRLGVNFTPKLIPIVEGVYAYEGAPGASQ